MQHILAELKQPLDGRDGGRCAVVLDEGFVFRTNEAAFVDTKRKLLDECDLWCILSLPGGVFSTAARASKRLPNTGKQLTGRLPPCAV